MLRDLRIKADVLLPPLPAGAVIDKLSFDRRSSRLAVALQAANTPAEVFVYDITPRDTATLPEVALSRWTQGEFGSIDPAKLVPAQLVEFPTWDDAGDRRRRLSAFVYRPAGPGPHPVVIDIHGGPESQFRPRWDAYRQYLVGELGYVVIAPNVRGSAGYGRSFLKLDDGALREDSVRDIGALLVWLGAQRDFDRNRVVVTGGSYGGYMALASLVQYGDRLAGGIDVVGISNFVTFLNNTSGYRRDLRRVEYGDERDPQMRALLTAISPLTNARSIRKPLLIVQGLNDPRVPASESEQMKAVARANGGEVWYLAARGRRPWLPQEVQQRCVSRCRRGLPQATCRTEMKNAALGAASSLAGNSGPLTSRRASSRFSAGSSARASASRKYSATCLISSGFSCVANGAMSCAVGPLRAPER